MIELAIALFFILLLGAASLLADRRFRGHDRLPMQWSIGGQVTWTAPRWLALSFTPALAGIVLLARAIAIPLSGDPRPGQEGLGPPIMMVAGLIFLGVHAVHLRLIARALEGGR